MVGRKVGMKYSSGSQEEEGGNCSEARRDNAAGSSSSLFSSLFSLQVVNPITAGGRREGREKKVLLPTRSGMVN